MTEREFIITAQRPDGASTKIRSLTSRVARTIDELLRDGFVNIVIVPRD